MSLRDNIHQLIRPHMTKRPDGKIVTRPALLDQLSEAVHTSKGGRRDTSETPLPINAAAIELWRALDTQARREEQDRTGRPRGHLGGIISRWESETRAEWVQHLEHATLDIIDQISDLLDPPPKRRKLREPCPACGERWVYDKATGDRDACLTAGTHDSEGAMRQPADYDVACAACGAEWRGKQLTWVLQVISDTPIKEVASM